MKKKLGFVIFAFTFTAFIFTSCNFFKNLIDGKKPDVQGVWEVTYFNNQKFPIENSGVKTQLFLYFSNGGKLYAASKITGTPSGSGDGLFKYDELTSDYEVSELGIETKFTKGVPAPCSAENGILKISIAGKSYLEAKKTDSPTAEEIKNAK